METAIPTAAVDSDDADVSTANTIQYRRSRHRFMLGVSAAVVLLAFLLDVVPHGRVAFRGFESRPLPHSCVYRLLYGGRCPGCGLTRGVIHFANGRIAASRAVHPLAWLIALTILMQFPYRLAGLFKQDALPLGRVVPAIFGWMLVALLIANWLIGML